jgi:endonuclease/exonuclease/phosphatase family metal-dependent hydrolase
MPCAAKRLRFGAVRANLRSPMSPARSSSAGPSASDSRVPQREFRLLTWNIHKGVGGTDRVHDIVRIIACLEHLAADIILLQEVAQDMPRLRHEDQVGRLTEGLQMHAAFRSEHRFSSGHYGNLVLSRFPIAAVHHCDLTIGRRKKRGCVQAQITVPFEGHQRTLLVHNLHLGLAGLERVRQLERLMAWDELVRHERQTPLIVAGDLNDVWASLGKQLLEPHGLQRAGQLKNSFPAALPLRPLDGIFFRGHLDVVRTHVAATRLARSASDHRPVVTDFLIRLH